MKAVGMMGRQQARHAVLVLPVQPPVTMCSNSAAGSGFVESRWLGWDRLPRGGQVTRAGSD